MSHHEHEKRDKRPAAGLDKERIALLDREIRNRCACVIGSMILDEEAQRIVRARLEGLNPFDVFADPRAAQCFATLCEMRDREELIEFSTLTTRLAMDRKLDMVGGPAYVVGTEREVFVPENVGHHLQYVLEDFARRQAMQALRVSQEALEAGQSTQEVAERTAEILRGLEPPTRDVQWTPPSHERGQDWLASLEADEGAEAVRNCHAKINGMTGGFLRGQLSTIAARAGTGKTHEIIQQALFQTAALGKTVLMFLLESNEQQLMERVAMIMFGVSGYKLRNRRLMTPADRQQVMMAVKWLGDHCEALVPWYQVPMTGPQVGAAVDTWVHQTGKHPDVIYVDTINTLLSPLPDTAATDHHAISANVMALWSLAARYQAAVICTYQLTKDSYGHKPSLADLKGTATIVEKSKLIYFPYVTPQDMLGKNEAVKCEYIVAKCNDGATGVVPGWFVRCHGLHTENTPDDWRAYGELLARHGAGSHENQGSGPKTSGNAAQDEAEDKWL